MISDAFIARVRSQASAVDIIGRRVPLVKRGAEHLGRCPFHDDTDPSLRVNPQKNLWNCSPCNSGGDAVRFVERYEKLSFPDALAAVAREAGIGGEVEHATPQLVATYRYEDDRGVLLGTKKRWEPAHDGSGKPKSFTWDRKPEWRTTLYRLPEVITAIGEARPVLVVEGEKCVDALLAAGIGATCNEDGAGKWETAHAEYLYGADVVVIPDNDAPGRAHAEDVAKSLEDIAQSVHRMRLPGLATPKGDVVDWLAEGHSTDELRALIASAVWEGKKLKAKQDLAKAGLAKNKWEGPIGKSALDLANRNMPSVSWLVKGLLSTSAIHVLAGEPKGGKTWMEAELAMAVATGTPVFGEFEVKDPGPVLMILLEDGERGLRNRLRALAQGRRMTMEQALADIRYETRIAIDLNDDDDCAGIVASARSYPEMPKLICIDPLRDANSGEESSNDDMRTVMHKVRAIREVTGATVLIVHHMSKPEGSKNGAPAAGSIFNRFRGASALRGAYDGGIAVETRQKDETNIRSKIEVEIREGRGAGLFGLHLNVIDDDYGAATVAGWAFYKDLKAMMGDGPEHMTREDRDRRAVLEHLRMLWRRDDRAGVEPVTTSSPPIAQALSIPEATVKRRLDDLVSEGRVSKVGRGWVFNPDFEEEKEP